LTTAIPRPAKTAGQIIRILAVGHPDERATHNAVPGSPRDVIASARENGATPRSAQDRIEEIGTYAQATLRDLGHDLAAQPDPPPPAATEAAPAPASAA
jgi:hypothetical protein